MYFVKDTLLHIVHIDKLKNLWKSAIQCIFYKDYVNIHALSIIKVESSDKSERYLILGLKNILYIKELLNLSKLSSKQKTRKGIEILGEDLMDVGKLST